MDINVYEINCQINFTESVNLRDCAYKLSQMLDKLLAEEEQYLNYHRKKDYKLYTFDLPVPCEPGKVYQKDKTYTFHIRSVDTNLVNYFCNRLAGRKSDGIIVNYIEIKIIPQKLLEKVYTLTPALVKTSEGYWRGHVSVAKYEKWLRENLIKKYNAYTGEKLDEDFELYDNIEFTNKKPTASRYKGITLLGDKLNIVPAKNETAQKLWYFALGTGILNNNSRGYGFLGYIWTPGSCYPSNSRRKSAC